MNISEMTKITKLKHECNIGAWNSKFQNAAIWLVGFGGYLYFKNLLVMGEKRWVVNFPLQLFVWNIPP